MIAERTLRLVKASDADSILITGGTTPLARAIIEVAKSSMFGVEWIASTVGPSFEDREYAESLGADETFDVSCNKGNWSKPFESGVNKKSYEIVIDIVGDSKHAKRLLKTDTGRFTSLFNKPTPEEILDFNSRVGEDFLNPTSLRILRSTVFSNLYTGCSGRRRKLPHYFSVLPSGDGEILERLTVLMDTGVLTPVIDKRLSVDDVPKELEDLKKNRFKSRGRLVVEF
jgi:NADPH:quinone reductase-like Zn-dependent oxidoreductase